MFEFVISLITAFINITLGLFTYFKNPKSATNKLFTFLTIQIGLWAVFNFFSLHAGTESATLLWIRLVMFVASFMGPTIYLLVVAFPGKTISLSKKYIYAVWSFGIITALLSLSPFLFSSVAIVNGNIQPQPGPAIPIFALNFVGFLIAAFITLVNKYKKSTSLERVQLKFLLLGIIVTFSLVAITNFIFVVLLNISSFVSIGPLFTLILIGFIFYAIIKHRFLDIRLIVARTVTYVLLLSILGGYYSIAVFLIGTSLFSINFSTPQLLLYGLLTIVVAFTFQRLKGTMQHLTESIFYKSHYNSQELLKSFSFIMSSTIELKALSLNIIEKVIRDMKATRGIFVLYEKENKKAIGYIEQKGFKELPSFIVETLDRLLKSLKIIIIDELEEGNKKELLNKLNVSVVMPLVINEKKIGIFCLGEKASGDIYSKQDIEIFEILAPQLALAINNAQEYEEIRRFNITLHEEIEKETKELKRANEQLKQLDKLKDEFVSVASHELRTPMTVIKSYVWLLLNDKTLKLNEKQRENLSRTSVSVERLIKLVNDMLNVSRIESGRIIIEKEPTDLIKLTQDVVNEISQSAKEEKINLSFEPETQNLPKVLIDPDRTKEILINLIGNSLKFTPESGKIKVSLHKNGGEIITQISDNGVGIKKDDIPKLFQKFGIIAGNYLEKKNTQGTGLGLYISKAIVELQGGKMWAESLGENKGSIFSFSSKITR